MSRRFLVFSIITLTVVATAVMFYFFTADDGVSDRQYRDAYRKHYKVFTPPMPEVADFCGEVLPLERFYVYEALDREILVNTFWHNQTLLLFKRAHRWFPVIEPILAEHGIPGDFKYLALIESGLSNAVSPSGATGFWQFLEGTAKDFGLEVNRNIDERYHVEKSTAAACRYLRDAYVRFGNWTLVAAAYNGGNRRISELLQEQQAGSYYDMLLAEETARYVFRIVAFKAIFEKPTRYGFYLREKDFYPPVQTKTLKVDQDVKDLVAFAAENGLTYRELKIFNPWLREKTLKVKKGAYYMITIPDGEFRDYESLKRQLNDEPVIFRDTLLFEEL